MLQPVEVAIRKLNEMGVFCVFIFLDSLSKVTRLYTDWEQVAIILTCSTHFIGFDSWISNSPHYIPGKVS